MHSVSQSVSQSVIPTYLDDEGVGEGGQNMKHSQSVGRHVVHAVPRACAHSEIWLGPYK